MGYQEELCRAIDIASEQAKTAARRGASYAEIASEWRSRFDEEARRLEAPRMTAHKQVSR